ncbi:MAG: hypothetical protein K2Q18_15550 [Bdellovibrionales bacterium]|nr:hypothetical protein [Bdellovibrionales bacterium]
MEISWDQAMKGENAIYKCKEGVERRLSSRILWETPSPLYIIKKIFDIPVEFNTSDAQKMATECRALYVNEFDLVGCVSIKVNKFFSNKKFTGMNTFCKSHSYAFDSAFKALNIPRSNSSTINVLGKFGPNCESSSHVVNKFVLVSASGQPYSYVVDTGWYPINAYPLTKDTIKFQKSNFDFPNLHDSFKYSPCESNKIGPFAQLKKFISTIQNIFPDIVVSEP